MGCARELIALDVGVGRVGKVRDLGVLQSQPAEDAQILGRLEVGAELQAETDGFVRIAGLDDGNPSRREVDDGKELEVVVDRIEGVGVDGESVVEQPCPSGSASVTS